MSSHPESSRTKPWFMLLSRSVLFLSFQALFTLILWLTGRYTSLQEATRWWPVGVFLSNLVCVFLLIAFYKQEGKRFSDVFRINKSTIRSDLLALVLIFPVIGALGFFPNLLLGKWLFGDSLIALRMYIQPLPLWATIVAVALFPITQGIAELPTYFAYSMPRLESQTGNSNLAVGLVGFFLSLQHVFIPLIFDYRFILWRGLMFLPFALAIGALLKWRPRLLPYLAAVHILMDFSLAPYFLGA